LKQLNKGLLPKSNYLPEKVILTERQSPQKSKNDPLEGSSENKKFVDQKEEYRRMRA